MNKLNIIIKEGNIMTTKEMYEEILKKINELEQCKNLCAEDLLQCKINALLDLLDSLEELGCEYTYLFRWCDDVYTGGEYREYYIEEE